LSARRVACRDLLCDTIGVPPKRKTSLRCPVDVFGYHDYRVFLADFYAAKKPHGFSYRAFSYAAGLGAPNYLKLVITGKRNLSLETANTFATTCGLGRDAARYFVTLVSFNQAGDADERNRLYSVLASFGRYRRAHKLALEEAAYHSTWYLPAIRELVLSPHFQDEPAWIAQVLWPPVTETEARHALDVLLTLGLLHRDAEGRLVQRSTVVSTGAQTTSLHIRNYHAQMMQRAQAAMETVPASEREISSLTMCLSPSGMDRIRSLLEETRRGIIDICETDIDTNQVVQLNFQLFPLSRATSAGLPQPSPPRAK
jgi:uncharacterized protein (TIGR02147 family)